MYKKEYGGFREALYSTEEMDLRVAKMWRYLEDLFGDDDDIEL